MGGYGLGFLGKMLGMGKERDRVRARGAKSGKRIEYGSMD